MDNTELFDDFSNLVSAYWYILECYRNGLHPFSNELQKDEDWIIALMDKYKLR
jgi:hypothetical protein